MAPPFQQPTQNMGSTFGSGSASVSGSASGSGTASGSGRPKRKTDPKLDELVKAGQEHDKMLHQLMSGANDEDKLYFEACTKRIQKLDEDIKSWLKFKCEENFYQAESYQRKKNSMSGSGYFVPPPHYSPAPNYPEYYNSNGMSQNTGSGAYWQPSEYGQTQQNYGYY